MLNLYEVLDVIEGGGMGLVYRVRHRGWGQDLAVKSPLPGHFTCEEHLRNFEAEAETWVRLGLHPYIVGCAYLLRVGGAPCVFAEWIDGGSLADWVHGRRLYEGGADAALRRILDVAIQMAWGLAYAHEQELVHQDVKPANVMLTPEGVAKVTDFGLARARSTTAEPVVAGTTTLLACFGGLTPAYCSPEQAQAADAFRLGTDVPQLSRATDVWSWALSVLEMFMGTTPCHYGQTAGQVLDSFLSAERPAAGIPEPPDDLARVLRRCFARAPGDRPRRMTDLADQLADIHRAVLGEPYPRQRPSAAALLADGLSNQALSMLDLGRPEQAETLWGQALRADPHHPHTVYSQGLHRWRAGRITDEQLVTDLEGVTAAHPGDWVGHHLLGLVHLERADTSAARTSLSRAADHGSGDPALAAALDRARARPDDRPRSLDGHTKGISSVRVSADGAVALSAGRDWSVRRWEPGTGRCLGAVGGLDTLGPVLADVALSADGRVAIFPEEDRLLGVFDPRTGEHLRGLDIGWPSSVAVSADGGVAVISRNTSVIEVWDTTSGRQTGTLKGHTASHVSVSVSADGGTAVSGTADRSVRVWDTGSGRARWVLLGHTEAIGTVAVSADGWLAFSTGETEDRAIRVWDAATGRPLRTLHGHAAKVAGLAAGGAYLVSGGWDHTVRVWELDTGRCLRTIATGYLVTAVAAAGNPRAALSGGMDGEVTVWPLPEGERSTWSYARPRSAVDTLRDADVISATLDGAARSMPGGRFADAAAGVRAARAVDGYARQPELLALWRRLGRHGRRTELRAVWQHRLLTGHSGTVNAISMTADGRLALCSDDDHRVCLWEPDSGRRRDVPAAFTAWADSTALSPDGGRALVPTEQGLFTIWTPESEQLRYLHCEPLNIAAALSPDGRRALIDGMDLTLFDLKTGRVRWTVPSVDRAGVIRSVAMSTSGNVAMSGDDDGLAHIWDPRTGRLRHRLTGNPGPIWAIALSAEGTVGLTGGADSALRVWNTATGQRLRDLSGHTEDISAVALSADGSIGVSESWDRTVRIWDTTTGECLRRLDGHTDIVWWIAMSADAHVMLSGTKDSTIRVWHLDWDYHHRPRSRRR